MDCVIADYYSFPALLSSFALFALGPPAASNGDSYKEKSQPPLPFITFPIRDYIRALEKL
jgi:hypothetical protein